MYTGDLEVSLVDRETFKLQNNKSLIYYNDCFNRITKEYERHTYIPKDSTTIPEIRIVPTNECQLSCEYCDTIHDRKLNLCSLIDDFSIISKWIDYYASKYNRFAICFVGGGEPTINNSLIEFVLEYISPFQNEIIINVITNGLMHKELCDIFMKKNANLIISLDGPYNIWENQQENKLPRKVFGSIVSNIEYLIEKAYPFSVNSVVTLKTLIESSSVLTDISSWFLNIGVPRLTITIDNHVWQNKISQTEWNAIISNYVKLIQWVPKHPEIRIFSDMLVSRNNYLDHNSCQSVFLQEGSISILPNRTLSYCYNDQKAGITSSGNIESDKKIIYEKNNLLRNKVMLFRNCNCDQCIARQICFAARCPACFKKYVSSDFFCDNLRYFRGKILEYYMELLNA